MFEKCRNNSLKNYGLLSSHLFSAPGLSWDAMPKMTKLELPDMYISFGKGIRGGISYISNRTAKPTINIYNVMNQNKNQNILQT